LAELEEQAVTGAMEQKLKGSSKMECFKITFK